ncbi:MAG TPA: hypothetical protein VJ892_01220 [Candidatus Absconditabacterales bacterium]|nr:hypothetical protein [Candidatus Absconditabacterales bacterium]
MSLLSRDIKRIIKGNIGKLLGISLVMGFLFYLFNIFFGLNEKIDDINKIITDKVGIYFYIDDSQSEDIYKRVIGIKDQLKEKGVDSNFSSKDDAFNFLENKIPEITNNFERFGINNPLPSTLYVMFNSKKEYNDMKDIIVKNKDIILNIKDIDDGATLQQQENRSLRILEIANVIKISTYFILIIIGIIILTFTQHLLKSFFYDFYKELQTKKLLGATKRDTNGGFILTLLSIITVGYIVGFILTCITFTIISNHLLNLGINTGLCNVLPKTLIVYLIFSLLAVLLGYHRLHELEKKL